MQPAFQLLLPMVFAAVAGQKPAYPDLVRAPVLDTITVVASPSEDPKPGTVASIYPAAARKAGTRGVANLICQVTADRHLGNCKTLSEKPDGMAFGAAAQIAAPYARVPDDLGLATDSPVIVPFFFDVAQDGQKISDGPGEPVSRRPIWVRPPTGYLVSRYYPDAAQRANVRGSADVDCHVAADGHLTDCLAVREAPYGWGFGEAGVRLFTSMQMKAKLPDGTPVAGGEVRLQMEFRVSGS